MKENSCLILPYVPANSDYKIHAVGWHRGGEEDRECMVVDSTEDC